MKRWLAAALAASQIWSASAAWAGGVLAVPEIAAVPSAPLAAPAPLPALGVSALAPSAAPALPTPALGAAPSFAASAVVAAPAPAAALAPAAAAAPMAAAAAPAAAAAGARAQVELAAAPLASPGIDVAGHLGRVYDSAPAAAAAATPVAAAAADESARLGAGPARAAGPAVVERRHASPAGAEARELQRLTASLAENGLAPARAAVVEQAVDDRRPTVAILAPASRHKVAIAREGGRQAPGDVHLVLDASWLIQREGPDGRARLLMTKGVVFDAEGQATIVEYKTPRVVRYFANYFTLGGNDRDDGVPFERNLDVPQSSSLQLEAVVNDKLRMSLLGAAHGVEVPAMLTFAMPAHPLAAEPASAGAVAVRAMPRGADKAAEIRGQVDQFLEHYQGQEIVVKPSGPQFHSGRGVKFFTDPKNQRDEISAYVSELSNSPMMTADGAVIVTGRVNSAPLERDGRKMETTLRVLVARTPSGGAVTTDIFGRVGPWGKPTTAEAADPRDNATVEPWERLLKDWGLSPREARQLDARVRAMGVRMMKAIIGRERRLRRKDGEPYQAQSDLVGLDVMIERRGDQLVPVMIEVNDHDSGGQYNLDRHIATDRVGTHSREWVATMLQRARRDALRGKRVVLVGAGYEGKRFIFKRAKRLGVKITLVDSVKNPFVARLLREGLVDRLIDVDNTKPAQARARALRKLRAAARRDGEPDAITTFWEDDVVLTAGIAADMGLRYHSLEAATVARDKRLTQEALAKAGLPHGRSLQVPNLSLARSAQEREAMLAEFRRVSEEIGYPAVLKAAGAAAAIANEPIDDAASALAAYERVSALADPKTDAIFARNSDLLLMEKFTGPEFDVDMVFSNGEPTFVSVADNKPTRDPSFLATGSRLPSTLPADRQKAIGDAAVEAARALGLREGVLHFEGMDTPRGVRFFDPNPRMGGTNVRDWVLKVWGVDLVEEAFMAAAGIPGRPYKPEKPLVHLDGDFINVDASGVVKAVELPEGEPTPGFVGFRVFKKPGDRVSTVENNGYARVAMIEAGGRSAEEARRNLEALRKHVRVEIDPDR